MLSWPTVLKEIYFDGHWLRRNQDGLESLAESLGGRPMLSAGQETNATPWSLITLLR